MSDDEFDIDDVLQQFDLSNETLKRISDLLLTEFKNGLDADKHDEATVKMFPTFVRDVPNGTEEGIFLSLDLGGSNFRVLRIDLSGKYYDMTSKIYEIPESVMTGSGEGLFDHIAKCLEDYVQHLGIEDQRLPLGFTFSFPCVQKGLCEAILIKWTKGFACTDVVGKDVVKMLRDALERGGFKNVDVIAVVNDTTGTLMSCAHMNSDCRVGLIVGTGNNACYMEKLENVGTWKGDRNPPDQVVINCEWGAFGDNGCLDFVQTSYDHEVDKNSPNKGKQIHEKMISGMYMGDIVRRIVVDFAKHNKIFGGNLPKRFRQQYYFKSKYVSFLESDSSGDSEETKHVIEKMEMEDVTREDISLVRRICTSVSTRSAHLVAAGVSTILNKMKREYTVVGVDGSVYRYHPFFKSRLEEKIAELTNPDYKFDLMLSEDGSGRGAALVAAVAARSSESLLNMIKNQSISK